MKVKTESVKIHNFLNPFLREGAGCINFENRWHAIGGENIIDDTKYWGTETFWMDSIDTDTGYLPVLPTSINVSKENLEYLLL